MISFKDIRPQLKKLIQEGFETADYIMRVSKTPKDGIYAYEELGEIVRCRNCKWLIEQNDMEGKTCTFFGTGICQDELETGYCAWGAKAVEE